MAINHLPLEREDKVHAKEQGKPMKIAFFWVLLFIGVFHFSSFMKVKRPFYCADDLDSSKDSLIDGGTSSNSLGTTVDATLLPGNEASLRTRKTLGNLGTARARDSPPCTGLKVSLLLDQDIDDGVVVDVLGESGPEFLDRLVGIDEGSQ